MCRLLRSWILDPGGWSKTAAVRLYFIFPGICTLSFREDVILEWIFLPCKPNKKLKTYIEKISDLIHKGYIEAEFTGSLASPDAQPSSNMLPARCGSGRLKGSLLSKFTEQQKEELIDSNLESITVSLSTHTVEELSPNRSEGEPAQT
ncbi:hypothetical protein STEG23_037915, partial [Scotinomys teguina]